MHRAAGAAAASGKRALHDYAGWSADALVARIRELEGRRRAVRPRKAPRGEIDLGAYPRRHVALRIAYLGWDYSGLASQQSYKPGSDGRQDQMPSAVKTVEDVLFDALVRCRLIAGPRDCAYSRCGRTDAGVSASSQVVALTLRSSQRRLSVGGDAFDLPVVATLNRALPDDVRVLAVAEAPPGFHARFDCRGRTYRYFFPGRGLDVSRMAAAAASLVGAHDFRNYCRRDPSGRAVPTTRTLAAFDIGPAAGASDWFVAQITASSFLYNQVRCMMAVLLRIGRRLAPVSLASVLLDTAAHPGVPPYDLADENPLVLAACHYAAPLVWSPGGDSWLPSTHWALSRTLMARALVARDVLSAIEARGFLPSVDPFWNGNHVIPPILPGYATDDTDAASDASAVMDGRPLDAEFPSGEWLAPVRPYVPPERSAAASTLPDVAAVHSDED